MQDREYETSHCCVRGYDAPDISSSNCNGIRRRFTALRASGWSAGEILHPMPRRGYVRQVTLDTVYLEAFATTGRAGSTGAYANIRTAFAVFPELITRPER